MNTTTLPTGSEVVWQGLYAGNLLRIVKNGSIYSTEYFRKDALGKDSWRRVKNQDHGPFFLHVIKDLLAKQKAQDAYSDLYRVFFGSKYPCNG